MMLTKNRNGRGRKNKWLENNQTGGKIMSAIETATLNERMDNMNSPTHKTRLVYPLRRYNGML